MGLTNTLSTYVKLELSDKSEEETRNQWVLLAFYDALKSRDAETVHTLLAPDLEWWFHGPPSHQFMMRILTGTTSPDFFQFIPQSVVAFGSTVLVEGFHKDPSFISWVHAWTVDAHGTITQVREYFNTFLTVTRFGNGSEQSSPVTTLHCASVWESSLSGESVPGLVLVL